MTARWLAAPRHASGAGRSAPSARRMAPPQNCWGRSAKPVADLPRDVCNFRLSEVRNFRLKLTVAPCLTLPVGKPGAQCPTAAGPWGFDIHRLDHGGARVGVEDNGLAVGAVDDGGPRLVDAGEEL